MISGEALMEEGSFLAVRRRRAEHYEDSAAPAGTLHPAHFSDCLIQSRAGCPDSARRRDTQESLDLTDSKRDSPTPHGTMAPE